MGIIESVKTGVQKNLTQKYIRRVLNILAKKPVFYFYGKSFSTRSHKYSNYFTTINLRNAYSKNKQPLGFGSLFIPYELLYSLKIKPFLPEVVAGFTASMGFADKTLKEASSHWYSQDLCTFHRSASGAVSLDLFPKPDFIFTSNLACDAAQKAFYIYAKNYDIEKNYYLIDVPHEYSRQSVKYLAGQLEEISHSIAEKTGSRLDMDRFREVIGLSNEFRRWALKINKARKTLKAHPKNFNGLSYLLPFFGLSGTRESIILYKQMYADFIKANENGSGKDLNNRGPAKKILWLHLKPYYKSEIFDILEKENCRVAFEEINNVYWPELDPDKPFESFAKKMLSSPLRGEIDNRVKAILKMAKDYNVDGVILFSQWGCRQSNGGSRIIKDSLKDIGIPTLVLDGDCVDRTNSSTGQTKTRLQGFIEILNSR